MHDISMLLEIERVIFKSFNALVANCLLPEREKIAVHLEPPDEHQLFRKLDAGNLNPNVKKNNELLDYFMTFIEESLKFITMGFFKRCRIITMLLSAIQDVSVEDSRESIF